MASLAVGQFFSALTQNQIVAALITVPVLLVTGENSPRPYGVMMEALAPCLKQHEKITIPNAAHAMNRANPQAYNGAVLEFLAKH